LLETIQIQKSKYSHCARLLTKAELVDFEARIVLLEEQIKHIEGFIESRKTSFQSHFGVVEKKIDELSLTSLESYKLELQTIKKTWGSHPFEEYVHEKGGR
jgi:hypothetical protein